MTTKIIIPIIVFVFVGVAHSGEIIESERITNWGEWGSFHRCPNGTFAQGFRLRTEPYKGALIDDTASNAVRLFCGDPGKKLRKMIWIGAIIVTRVFIFN